MDEFDIIRSLLLRIGRNTAGTTPLARALLDWARGEQGWLMHGTPRGRLGWRALLAALETPRAEPEPPPHALGLAAALGEALGFADPDRALLTICVAIDRCPRVAAVARVATKHGCDLPTLVGQLSDHDPHQIRRSPVLRLGLVTFRASRTGEVEVDIGWALERLLDRAVSADDGLIETLVGLRQEARLSLADFGGHEREAAMLARLLAGALAEKAVGVNILIHGPPGTGKTELARALAAAAGAELFSVGEADVDGDEPSRWDRVNAFQLAQRVLAGRRGALLLFDEMEDLIGEARPSGEDWFARRDGSKVFVNRLLETNAAPVIWTTNAIGNIDPAILRRMSFVLRLDFPSRGAGRRMLERIGIEEGVPGDEALERLVDAVPEASTVLRVAARAGRLAGGAEDAGDAARSLVRALRGGEPLAPGFDAIDLDLFETDVAFAPLFERFASAGGACDFSLLLTGAPGTGKTGLAHHLARTLDRPLITKRASDLLSKWVGGTEARIAEAFEEARRADAVLLFDEVDSLLFDRTTAQQSWEVTQVNELLTWLDRHPLPFIAATNHPARLDPAALRRFVFKIELRAFGPERRARAFGRFFGMAAPPGLADLVNLTAGDFAVVARQLRHTGPVSGEAIVERLRAEADLKPGVSARLGF